MNKVLLSKQLVSSFKWKILFENYIYLFHQIVIKYIQQSQN